MFPNHAYYEINREERHFCFLLGHALLTSVEVRHNFYALLNTKLAHSDNPFEVYVEVAALRDYWNALGNPRTYSAQTDQARYNVLASIFRHLNLPHELLSDACFKTTPTSKKLRYPGNWDEQALHHLVPDQRLHAVKWAFKAKPDMLLIDDQHMVLIEAKLESTEGRDNRGYSQFVTQEHIVALLKLLTPKFRDATITHVLLEKQQTSEPTHWQHIT